MNIASWLSRAGLSHPALPAVGQGPRVTQSYGALAERAARLAGALRALGLKPGDRVAIIAKNCVEYLETIYGIWHGGFAAVPANAKLHGRELGYILEHSGARVCFATPGLDAEVAPHAPQSLERLIVIGSEQYRALFARRSDAGRAARRQRSRLAVLHLRHHRPAEGRDADPSHLAQASFAYLTEVDAAAPGDSILHAAPMSHGSGLYMMAHVGAARDQCGAGIRRLRAGRDLPPVRHLAAHVDVRRAHHGEAAGRFRRRRRPGQPAHHRVGRRADVCRGRPEGARSLRPAPRADLRPGRKPDDDHDAVAGRTSPTASIRAGSSGSARPGGPMPASR